MAHQIEKALDILKKSDDPYYRIMAEAAELHHKKMQDYGSDDDPYQNMRASVKWGIPEWVGVSLRLSDKEFRLQTFATKGELANESARDSMIDNVNYNIFRVMFYDEASSNVQ